MANYGNLETDFIERTLELISQYESLMQDKYEFEKQFNHTLLVNCLLGLIVMPRELIFSHLPTHPLTPKLKAEMGLKESFFNQDFTELRPLIFKLRNAIAHFEITFESEDQEASLIDRIVFRNKRKGADYIIASFVPSELLSFLRYYGNWILSKDKNAS